MVNVAVITSQQAQSGQTKFQMRREQETLQSAKR